MAMSGAAEKAFEIFLKQLAIDESFAAPGNRQTVPTDGQQQCHNHPGMKGEFHHQIPTPLGREKSRDDEPRQNNS